MGCPMVILSKKLQFLKQDLKAWNKNTFGNIFENMKMEEDRLGTIQNNIQTNGMTDAYRLLEAEAQSNLSKALAMEEQF